MLGPELNGISEFALNWSSSYSLYIDCSVSNAEGMNKNSSESIIGSHLLKAKLSNVWRIIKTRAIEFVKDNSNLFRSIHSCAIKNVRNLMLEYLEQLKQWKILYETANTSTCRQVHLWKNFCYLSCE